MIYLRTVLLRNLKLWPKVASLIFLGIILAIPCFCSAKNTKLSPHVFLVQGAVNGVFVEMDGHTLVIYGDPTDQLTKADKVLFTHCRRDVVWAGRTLVENGAESVVPVGEADMFATAEKFWPTLSQEHFHDYHPETKKIRLTKSLPVQRQVKQGDILEWQNMLIEVLETPGYTGGAVSYLVKIDNVKYAFVGDIIYGNGQLFDLYSLQNAIPDSGVHLTTTARHN